MSRSSARRDVRNVIFEVAYLIGLAPLAWLGVLTWRRSDPPDPSCWWLALAFAVSFLADTASRFLPAADRFTVSLLYPLTQAGLVGLVFLSRRDALVLVVALTLVSLGAVAWQGVGHPDILVHTACWGAAAGVVATRALPAGYNRWIFQRLRTPLLVYFAIGWLCWVGYLIWPGWTSWGLYQSTRAVGIGMFCAACLATAPRLSVSRSPRSRAA